MADFLLEIGTEEIPARMIRGAEAELQKLVSDLISRERLGKAEVGTFSTPRRLAVVAHGIEAAQKDVEEQVTGPSYSVAYKDGQPTKAAEAFAKKVGLPIAKLEKITTPKGEYIGAIVKKKGRSAADVFAAELPRGIAGIYWAKNMYWRAGKPERFVRPVRWLVAMVDDKVVALEFGGIKAGKRSHGHRILASGDVSIAAPAQYAAALAKSFVMPSPGAREEHIRKQLTAALKPVKGARWREDKTLLETVVNLTEYPSAVLGNFDPEFLELADEVLVTVMRDHQKYFAVEDSKGKLLPHFLAVLNTDGDPDGLIRHGNERVLRARFNDARFFWQTDQKIPLRERVQMLRHVTFQKDLGNYFDKAQRTATLSQKLANQLAAANFQVDAHAVRDAATLAKTDLTTELVKEFTELQGIVGGLYARAQGTGEAVANAIYDHYRPQSTEDDAPRTAEGALLSLADKADTIYGMFALGLQPTGSKDPFALRRQANGIIKTLVAHKLPISVMAVFEAARDGYAGSEAEKKFRKPEEVEHSLREFVYERREFFLRDVAGYAYDVVKAVLAADPPDIVDALARAEAVTKVRTSPDFAPISIAFKRMKNILRQAESEGKWHRGSGGGGTAAMEDAEKQLLERSREAANLVRQLRSEKKYEAALLEISKLRPVVDQFFDKVMVMVDDDGVRGMRLALLERLVNEFSTIADFSEIVAEQK
jgi:glycyl-tRNA synthetase beta chain